MFSGPSLAVGDGRSRLLVLPLALTFALPATSLAQASDVDSIAVIERGAPGVDGWDIAEFPFQVITAPLYLLTVGTGWAVDAASETNLPAWVVYANSQLNKRSLYPTVASLGSGSGTGAALLVGAPARSGAPWAYVRGGATYKRYWRLIARAGYGDEAVAPGRAGRLGTHVFGSTGLRPQDEFFGIGRESREEDRSDYELERQVLGAALAIAPIPNSAVRLELDWSQVETRGGINDRLVDSDSVFQPEEIPRFGDTDRYLSIGGSAEWRTGQRGLIPAQAWLRIGIHWNESKSDGAADFAEIEAATGAVLPFDHDRRSLALALLYRTARPSGSGDIPFYRLPVLGGSSTLSAYRTGRFRDRDLVFGQAEYAYRLWLNPINPSAVIASIFLQGGMVASDMQEDFAFNRLKPSYGTALSAVTAAGSGARLQLAAGDEGIRVDLTFLVGF